MTYYVISPSEDFTEGYFVGTGLLGGDKAHLTWDEVLQGKVTHGDTVVIMGWQAGLGRRDINEALKKIHDTGCLVLNGAGHDYGWSYPKPWEHDGNVPGSALT